MNRMAVLTVATDMEALVDLFLSPAFHPFEPEDRPSPVIPKSASATVVYEAEIEEDTDDIVWPVYNNKSASVGFESVHSATGISAVSTKHCGQVLASLGDEFYKSYMPRGSLPSTEPPWLSIGEKLRLIFEKVSQIKETDPNYKEESEKAWNQFTEIMSKSVSDTLGVDVNKQLGAVLLTLHGLTNLATGVRGVARAFYIRYIGQRHLDAQIRQLGNSSHLRSQDLD